MTTNTRTQYKILVEEYNDFTLYDISLLNRDNKEPVIYQGLNFKQAERMIDDLIEEYNINDHSKIIDIIYDKDEKEIQREEMTIREFKEIV
jgi:hypothetical protein